MTSTERDPAWSERLNPRNWSLAAKLVAVGLVPTLLALVLGVLRISDQAGVAAQLGEDNRLLDIRQGVTTTSQALQAERNAAVLFVAGNRAGDRGPLDRAVAASDTALDQVRTGLTEPGLLDASGTTALQNAEGGFTQLSVLRSEVGNSVVPADAVRERYTAIIQRSGVLERALVRQAASADTAGLGDAVTATSEAREALALQHTTLAGAIVAREVREQDRTTVTGTDAAFTSAFADYQVALTPAQLGRYGNFATDGANVDRERLRSEIMATPAGDPVVADPASWDAAYASSVAVVDSAAAGVGEELTASSVAAQESASNQAGVNSVILMLGVLLGIAIIVLLARTLIRSLRILRRSALDVAERKLPAAVESMRSGQPLNALVEPVPLTGHDEVAQVARAFDAVHGQAIRLAADQAALQSNVSNMFVNLSRRSQALVERQLQLIEQLESNEQDPDQLSNLFQLDHLATRMRRNSENLLVLAGTDLAKRNVAPVPVVDVLRAAVSEIEQYQRVVVQPPPVATVAGRAASDVVHLIAELLDNATNFSPPDSQVVMATTRANDGSLIVEIADRGVGMADHELSEANQRLGQPAAVDVSASRRMGLFVVGRLANRHGLGIRLGGGSAGGTGGGLTATVTVPSTLVPSAEPMDRRPARAGAVPGGASAFGGAPALPSPASSPSVPSLPAQRPGANGRSLSSLVAGDDGPMSPAPAFGGGRPPTPPVNGNGLPQRRPGSVPPEDGPDSFGGRPSGAGSGPDDAAPDSHRAETTGAQPPRPAGPERGPWPVESLRRPPNGEAAPTRQTNGFTGNGSAGEPGALPKRTPRGVNGTQSTGTQAGAAGLAAGAAAGVAGASAPRRGPESPSEGERPGVGESVSAASASDTGAARGRPQDGSDQAEDTGYTPPREAAGSPAAEADTPATGAVAGPSTSTESSAAPEGTADRVGPRPTFPSGLPRRTPTVDGGGTAAPSGLPRRTPDGSSPSASPTERTRPTPADSERAPATSDDSTATQAVAPTGSATAEQATAGSAATERSTADRADGPQVDAAQVDAAQVGAAQVGAVSGAGGGPDGVLADTVAEESAATSRAAETGAVERAADTPAAAGLSGLNRTPEESTDGPVQDSGGAPDPSRETAPDAADGWSTGGFGSGALGGAALGGAALGGAALGAAALGAATAGRSRTDGRTPDPAGTEMPQHDTASDRVTAEHASVAPHPTDRDSARPESAGQDSAGQDSAGQDSAEGSSGTVGGGPEGLPQRRPRPSRASDRMQESRPPEQIGGLPRRNLQAPDAELGQAAPPRGGPVPRETPPTGPAGLPQRTPRRPKQATLGGTEALFAPSTPGDTQTTGQLRRPGGFASRTPTRGARGAAAQGAEDRTATSSTEVSAEAFGTGSGSAPVASGTGGNGTGVQDTGSSRALQGFTGPGSLPSRAPRPANGLPQRETPGGNGLPARDQQDAPGGRPPHDPQGLGGPPNRTSGLPAREPQDRTGPPAWTPQGPPPREEQRPPLRGPGGLPSRTPGAHRGGPTPPPPARPQAPDPRDDAGLPGSSGAAPEPSRGPSGFDLGQTTPIFEEIASAWFRSNGDVPVRWAEGGAEPEAQPEPAAEPVFATAADEGWRVADATAQATAAESDAQAETTDAGLPKRRPRARLVPGSAAGSAVLAPPSGPARNAEAIRGRLASYQQGVRQGRESRLRRQSTGQPGVNEQNEENR